MSICFGTWRGGARHGRPTGSERGEENYTGVVAEEQQGPVVAEAHWELTDSFLHTWIDGWPQAFLSALMNPLKEMGIASPRDFAFERDPSTLGDACLKVTLRRWDISLRIFLDRIVVAVPNLRWTDVPEITEWLDQIRELLANATSSPPVSRHSRLLLHIRPGSDGVAPNVVALVNQDLLGEAESYGVLRYRKDQTIEIAKSLRYPNGVFVRIERDFSGQSSIATVLSALADDQAELFNWIGQNEVR